MNDIKNKSNKNIEQSDIDEVSHKLNETEEWLNNNENEISEVYNTKVSEIQQFLQPFMLKLAAADNIHTDDDNNNSNIDEELDFEASIGDLD